MHCLPLASLVIRAIVVSPVSQLFILILEMDQKLANSLELSGGLKISHLPVRPVHSLQ